MPMYTREEAAEILGVCVNTLDRMRKERKIGYYQARLNRPLSSRQMKKEKLRHEGLVPVSKGSQAL